jgi:hypothetical protein
MRHGDVNVVKKKTRTGACTAAGCSEPRYAKALCKKHYYAQFKLCVVEGCNEPARYGGGLCLAHGRNLKRNGTVDYIRNTLAVGETRERKDGYIVINHSGERKLEHIVLAEKALGRPLPSKAVVHHINEDRADNRTPFNLIICPNQEYHMLLHKRARALGYRGKIYEIDELF